MFQVSEILVIDAFFATTSLDCWRLRMSQLILYMPTPHETLQLGQLHMPDIYVQAI